MQLKNIAPSFAIYKLHFLLKHKPIFIAILYSPGIKITISETGNNRELYFLTWRSPINQINNVYFLACRGSVSICDLSVFLLFTSASVFIAVVVVDAQLHL